MLIFTKRALIGASLTLAVAFILLLYLTAQAAAPVSKGHPHFEVATAAINADGALVVSFQEAGLGHVTAPLIYTSSADTTATYTCLDAAGVAVATAAVTVTETATVTPKSHSGQITGSMTLAPPGPGAFVCPVGTTLVLASVTDTAMSVTDVTHAITAPIPGPLALALI